MVVNSYTCNRGWTAKIICKPGAILGGIFKDIWSVQSIQSLRNPASLNCTPMSLIISLGTLYCVYKQKDEWTIFMLQNVIYSMAPVVERKTVHENKLWHN
jgi:hypothetical protein